VPQTVLWLWEVCLGKMAGSIAWVWCSHKQNAMGLYQAQ
jgi:hypothetical protein